MDKIKVASIILRRAEGRHSECGKTVGGLTWEEAQAELVKMGHSAPKKGEGYDKVDFQVTFDDGQKYDGRYDLQEGGQESDGSTLREHVRLFLQFIGCIRPPHLSTVRHDAFWAEHCEEQERSGDKEEALAMLERYDI